MADVPAIGSSFRRTIYQNGHVAFITIDVDTGLYQWSFAYQMTISQHGYAGTVDSAEHDAREAMKIAPPGSVENHNETGPLPAQDSGIETDPDPSD